MWYCGLEWDRLELILGYLDVDETLLADTQAVLMELALTPLFKKCQICLILRYCQIPRPSTLVVSFINVQEYFLLWVLVFDCKESTTSLKNAIFKGECWACLLYSDHMVNHYAPFGKQGNLSKHTLFIILRCVPSIRLLGSLNPCTYDNRPMTSLLGLELWAMFLIEGCFWHSLILK